MRELHWVWTLCLAAAAQASDVRGRIVWNGISPGELFVELTGSATIIPSHRVLVDGTGQFTLRNVSPGQYEVRVTDSRGVVLQRDFVLVQSESEFLTVRIATPRLERPGNGTVSWKELAHRPPGKAVKAFQEADQLAAKGDMAGAAAQLAKAVGIDPQYARAYANLGACYARLNREQEALAALARARELDPSLTAVHNNIAQLLLRARRHSEAEEAARAAVQQEPSSEPAHFLLGASLARQQKNEEEALEHLRRAGTIPRARLYAADIFTNRGDSQRALQELRAYLPSAPPGERAAVEAWIARLKN